MPASRRYSPWLEAYYLLRRLEAGGTNEIVTESIHHLLHACPQTRVLVVGDLMLDRYLWGRVERISPEAPVPVVEVEEEESRPGGAANVAWNLHGMGAQVVMCGVVGADAAGDELLAHAAAKGFETAAVLRSDARRTTVKTRVMGNQQQVLRVDREDRFPLGAPEAARLFDLLAAQLPHCHALIFQDYDKGLLGPELIGRIMAEATRLERPVVVDPKFRNFFAYRDCSLFKPNLKELNEGLGLRLKKDDIPGIVAAVQALRARMPHAQTLVTLSENGMLLVDTAGQGHHIAAHYREIVDVSGAGDTVVAVAALGLAAGLPPLDAVRLANLAGGLVCEEVGVVPVDPRKLAAEALRLSDF